MAFYTFNSEWKIEADIQEVWNAISEEDKWPEWWESVLEVKTIKGRGTEVTKTVWKSFLPYKLIIYSKIIREESPGLLEVEAWGDLAGTGVWRLTQEGNCTCINIDWEVETTHWFMDLASPVGRPLFELNHNWLMGKGAAGLGELLNAQVHKGLNPDVPIPEFPAFPDMNKAFSNLNSWFGRFHKHESHEGDD